MGEVELGSRILAKESRTVSGVHDAGDFGFSKYGQKFTCVGAGNDRKALLGSDGVVYKFPWNCFCTSSIRCTSNGHRQTEDELRLFRHASGLGFSWAPDFWYYSCCDVMAMPYYNQETYGLTAHLELSQPDLIQEIGTYTHDFCDPNFGLREDGSVVLIDGGRSTITDELPPAFVSPGGLVS